MSSDFCFILFVLQDARFSCFVFFPLYLPVAKRCLPLPSFLPFSLPSHLDEATLDHVYIKAPFLQSILGSCFSIYKLRSLTFSGGSYKSILFASALFSLSCSFCQAVLAYCGDLWKEYEWLLTGFDVFIFYLQLFWSLNILWCVLMWRTWSVCSFICFSCHSLQKICREMQI